MITLFNLFLFIFLFGVIIFASSFEDVNSEEMIASYKMKKNRAERLTKEEILTFWVSKLTLMGVPLMKIGAIGLFLVSIFL